MGGRPPAPLEHHRRVGRNNGTTKANGDPIGNGGELAVLPMATSAPPLPAVIEPTGAGADLWRRAWDQAITWLSPHSDMSAVVHACEVADALQNARKEWYVTHDHGDARVMIALGKQFGEALAALGFTPVARARLGVAEVKRVSALQEMMDRRQNRSSFVDSEP